MRSSFRAVPALVFALALLSVTASGQEATNYPELPRFQQVNERLYRSAQPHKGGVKLLQEPKDARIARILEVINAPESGRVLIHCRSGVDRTGMIVALNRMQNEGWTSADALAEAERNGMRRIQFWMRDYTADYGARVEQSKTYNMAHAQHVDGDNFGDQLGVGMRVAERNAFKVRKIGSRFLRKVLQGFDN